jgi:uncharacterized protein (DUF4415 family)
MNEQSITTVTLEELLEKRARGEKSLTDWARVDATTDEDIERAIKDDPDWAEFSDVDWSDAVIVYPIAKTAISLQLDEDVLEFFKATGKGYQTRMNAVLRHYMTDQTKPARGTPNAKLRPKAEPDVDGTGD